MYDVIIGRSDHDKEKLGKKGTILLGKHFVKMGRVTSLSNPVYMDMTRSHVVFVCGKRGGGKCILENTLVTLATGEKITIQKLYEKYSQTGIKDDEKDDYYKLSEKLLVQSYDLEHKKIVKKRVTHVFRRKIKEKMVRWNLLSDNKEISLDTTSDHKILTETPTKEFIWKTSKDKSFETVCGLQKEKLTSFFIKEKKNYDFEGYVYDLTVEETHNFIANDIIVHNSYTMGVIAEGMADLPPEIKQNIAVIMLDTMGIYWTMKYPNKKDKEILQQWGLTAKPLDVKIYTPAGYYKDYKEKGIPTDHPFGVKPGELSASDWLMTFDVHEAEPVGVLIERVVNDLSDKKGRDYSIEDIEEALLADKDADQNTKLAAKNRFSNAKRWGLFSNEGTEIAELAKGGQITVLDVSCYATMPGSWNIKNLVIGLVAQKLFIQRMLARKDEEYHDVHKQINPYSDDSSNKQDYPLVWLIIDEAHEFLPVTGKTMATDPLVTILREGRQPGISLILATQQPGKIHTDVMTQSDTVISHRITARLDTEALGMLMQSYMRQGLTEQLDNLPRTKGAAIIFDDTNERMYPISIRPRFTWHGGESPNALKEDSHTIKF
jgi:hypothetical protein